MKRSQLSWQWCSVELVDGFYGTFKNSMAGNCDRDHESFSLNIQDTDNERLTVLLRDHSERYEEEQCPLGQRAVRPRDQNQKSRKSWKKYTPPLKIECLESM